MSLEQEVAAWIRKITGEHLQEDKLLDELRSGVVLCKLMNTLKPRSAKAKQSAMPFVQMENIASFLAAARTVGITDREMFLTVDLYEKKDPRQVLVMLSSLSRHAYNQGLTRIEPVGPKLGITPTASPNVTPKKPQPLPTSSSPSWNTYQYGYLGGATQANQGVRFGARREISTPEPKK